MESWAGFLSVTKSIPVSIMLPGCLSPRIFHMNTNPVELAGASVPGFQEQGESCSVVWYGHGTQVLIDDPGTSKWKEPMKDESPWSRDHDFKEDESPHAFWIGGGEGGSRSRRRDKLGDYSKKENFVFS